MNISSAPSGRVARGGGASRAGCMLFAAKLSQRINISSPIRKDRGAK